MQAKRLNSVYYLSYVVCGIPAANVYPGTIPMPDIVPVIDHFFDSPEKTDVRNDVIGDAEKTPNCMQLFFAIV